MRYDYRCPDGHITELILAITELDLVPYTTCPQCQKRAERIISPGSSFILDGDDWPGKRIKQD